MLNNNIIFKKLIIALSLTDDAITEIFALNDYNISKSQLNSIKVAEHNKNYRNCSDELLLKFLDGLIIYKRDLKK